MNKKEVRDYTIWFSGGLIVAIIGIFMMLIDSSIEYPEQSLMYILRPCYIFGETLVIGAVIYMIIFTIDFYNRFKKVNENECITA